MTVAELTSLLILNIIALVAMPFALYDARSKGEVVRYWFYLFALVVLLLCFILNAVRWDALL